MNACPPVQGRQGGGARAHADDVDEDHHLKTCFIHPTDETLPMRISPAVRGCAVLTTMVLAACGGDARAAGPAVRDSAGIRIVQNERPAWKEGEGWRVADEPALDIGVVEGEAAYQFSGVSGVARLSDGRFVVADDGSGEVRFFSPEGRHLVSAGRKGGGPGEFQQLQWLGVGAADSVLVWDSQAGRLSVFAPDGAFARALKPDGLRMYPQVEALMGGGALLVAPGFDAAAMGSRPQGEFVDTAVWMRVPLAAGAPREVSRRPSGEMFLSKADGMFMTDQVVFGRSLHVAGSPDGYYAGFTDAFQVEHRGPDGALRRLIRRAHQPRKVTEADLDAHFERAAALRMQGLPPEVAARVKEMQRTQRDRVPQRATLPAFAQLLVDGAGNLWVRDPRPIEDEPHRWSVFDAEGGWLGTVETPAELTVRQIGTDWVLGTAKDEMDVEHVRMYRIQKPAAR
jgi:hypothetical protein